MQRHVPYHKLSKKSKRQQDLARRSGWGPLNPVTRTPPNPNVYNRKKNRREIDISNDGFCYYSNSSSCLS